MDNLVIDFPTVIKKFDRILSRGLCAGVGSPDGQMCIEAAICVSLGLPFGDNPSCVERAVRFFKIRLNDSNRWVSAESRARGLRDLGIAQIGSKGVVDGSEFSKRLVEKTIRILLPKLFRQLFPTHTKLLAVALRCEKEGTKAAASAAAADAADTASAAAATYAADAADAADASDAKNPESYLLLSTQLALEVLRELKSPGVDWL